MNFSAEDVYEGMRFMFDLSKENKENDDTNFLPEGNNMKETKLSEGSDIKHEEPEKPEKFCVLNKDNDKKDEPDQLEIERLYLENHYLKRQITDLEYKLKMKKIKTEELQKHHSQDIKKVKSQHYKTLAKLNKKLEVAKGQMKRRLPREDKPATACPVCCGKDINKTHKFTKGGELIVQSCSKVLNKTIGETMRIFKEVGLCQKCGKFRNINNHEAVCTYEPYDVCNHLSCNHRWWCCQLHILDNLDRMVKHQGIAIRKH